MLYKSNVTLTIQSIYGGEKQGKLRMCDRGRKKKKMRQRQSRRAAVNSVCVLACMTWDVSVLNGKAYQFVLETSLSFLHPNSFSLYCFFFFFLLVFVDLLSTQLRVSHINSQTRLYKLYIKAGELDQLQRKWIRAREHWHYCD